MNKREHLARYICLAAFFIIVCMIFIARLVSIQIAGQDYYTETSGPKNYTLSRHSGATFTTATEPH